MRRAPLALLVLLAALAAAPGVRAQEYAPAPEEQAFLALLDDQHKPIEAREAARSYLQSHPDSFIALLVTGTVCLQEDADLPRAYYYLTRGRKQMEKRWPEWGDETPWKFYGRTLWALRGTCQRMERYDEALDILKRHDEVFDPDRPAERAWSLMKLGRTEEARAAIAGGLASTVEEEQLMALNSLGALEAESDRPEKALEAFSKLYDLQKKLGRLECTFIRNLAETHQKLMNFSEAERFYLESSKYFDPDSESNPWQDLAQLYLDEGRLAEAADALKRMQGWSYRSKPVIGLDNWNNRQTLVACLLLRLGYTEEALDLARRAADRPDRHGYGSAQGEQWEASSLLFYRSALLDRAARLDEESSWAPWKDRPGLAVSWAADRLAAWSAGRRGARVLMGHGWLADTLRGTGPRSAIAFPGGESTLCDTVGAGVVEAEVRRLLERKGEAADLERPLLELLLGQCVLEGGDPKGALEALSRAETTLPQERGAFHDWIVALKARAHRSLGNSSAAMQDLALLMERDPGLVRREGLALPVVLEAHGGPRAADAVERLARSPRLAPGGGGFRLTVTQSPSGALEAILEGPDGAALASVRAPAAKDDEAAVAGFCRLFHQKAFAPKVDLSQADVNSLEGSTLAGDSARDTLKGILGETTPEGP